MDAQVLNKLTLFAKLYHVNTNPQVGMWLLYGTITVLSIVVYRLGFARKLYFLQNVVVYFVLVLGCTILTFFAVFLPIAEGLVVAIAVLGIYKIRLQQSKKTETSLKEDI